MLLLVCACVGTSRTAVSEVTAAVGVAHGTVPSQGAHSQQVVQPSELNPTSLLSIPGSSGVISFDAETGASAAATDASLDGVRAAVKDIEETSDCGFVFVDAVTGRGLAYNADKVMYIASAAKAPLVLYALQHGAGVGADERGAIEEAIVNSDNDSFESFAYDYTDTGYSQWLSAHDIDHADYANDLYPRMTARSLASIWLGLLQYVQTGSDNALWFSDLLAGTETSFIRDGLQGVDATVMNKGGWINEDSEGGLQNDEGEEDEIESAESVELNDDEVAYRSVSDAGVITCDGRTYVMVVLTTQPDGGDAEANVSALARALFDVRNVM